jgi:glucose-1-phosphate adenylyltransferase
VLIQFKSQSLLQHLRDGYEFSGILKNHYIIPVPAQMRTPGESWYRGTADAIYQNVNLIEQAEPDVIVIFGADHIYRMNIRDMVEFHLEKGSDATIAAIPVEKKFASEFGVIETAPGGAVIGFHEKNPEAPTMPGDDSRVYASMGNYVFSTGLLLKELYRDAEDEKSSHDFGRDILPRLVGKVPMYAYDFQRNRIPGDPPDQAAYWRDVGTIDSYYEASMDLRSVHPQLNLYNRNWPLRTAGYEDPPAKFTYDENHVRGSATDSIVSGGTIVSGGNIRNCIIGRGVKVMGGAEVDDSILFDNCEIGRGAKIRRAILDKNVRVPDGAKIGYDVEQDRKLYSVTESGIVVVEGRRSRVDVSSLQIARKY